MKGQNIKDGWTEADLCDTSLQLGQTWCQPDQHARAYGFLHWRLKFSITSPADNSQGAPALLHTGLSPVLCFIKSCWRLNVEHILEDVCQHFQVVWEVTVYLKNTLPESTAFIRPMKVDGTVCLPVYIYHSARRQDRVRYHRRKETGENEKRKKETRKIKVSLF